MSTSVSSMPRLSPQLLGDWRQEWLSACGAVPGLVENVAAAMMALDFPDRDVFAVRLALEEAVVNAVKHGNGSDPALRVEVRYQIGPERVLIEIEDQGPGFDPYQLADPLAPENRERPGGRGVLLMRRYLTWLRYNARGNAVTLCKVRTCSSPPTEA